MKPQPSHCYLSFLTQMTTQIYTTFCLMAAISVFFGFTWAIFFITDLSQQSSASRSKGQLPSPPGTDNKINVHHGTGHVLHV